MSLTLQIRVGALVVVGLGFVGTAAPRKAVAAAVAPYHCENTLVVSSCDHIPGWFMNYCSTCQLGVVV
jgi:hypothetical protein